jgi:phosphatidylinositol alpha-1,6-mannosyltransferase
VVTNDLPPRVGGVQQYVANLLATFPPEQVTVLAPAWQGWREHDAVFPSRVVRMPAHFLWPTPDLLARARGLAREVDAEVVLFTQGWPITGIGPALAAEGLPYVALTHGYEVWISLSPISRWPVRRALSKAHQVFAISQFTAHWLQSAVPSGVPLSLASPGVDADRFRPDLNGGPMRERWGLDGNFIVGCVGRLVPRKGQDVLIRAMPHLVHEVPDAVLVLVGHGPYEGVLRRMAEASPVRDRIVFAETVSDEELPLAYAAMDVFAMPCRTRNMWSDFEGFGIVFLEAAACGVPVVAGRSGGAAEAVVDEETGTVVDGRDPVIVADAIIRLYREPEVAKAMSVAGRERVEDRFTWERTGERVARALQDAAT